jgi:hypothetical protein
MNLNLTSITGAFEMATRTVLTPPAAAPAASDTGRTSDNTPLPGGGRWMWSDAAANWVDSNSPAADADIDTNTVNPEAQAEPINATEPATATATATATFQE